MFDETVFLLKTNDKNQNKNIGWYAIIKLCLHNENHNAI